MLGALDTVCRTCDPNCPFVSFNIINKGESNLLISFNILKYIYEQRTILVYTLLCTSSEKDLKIMNFFHHEKNQDLILSVICV